MLSNQRKKEILQSIEKANGRLAAEDVLKHATPKTSELHEEFEWNDKEAGHQFRINQARLLIRSANLRVTVSTVKLDLPFYLRDVTSSERGTYRRTETIKDDEDAARDTLVDVMSRVSKHMTRAKELASYFAMEGEVESIQSLAATVIDRLSDRLGGEA